MQRKSTRPHRTLRSFTRVYRWAFESELRSKFEFFKTVMISIASNPIRSLKALESLDGLNSIASLDSLGTLG